MYLMPRLKIVPVDDLILHEEFSPDRVKRLSSRITSDSQLKNPVVTAWIKEIGKYMVLDGATRTTAVKQLGFRDILVQIVDYHGSSITLDTWHHMVPAGKNREFIERVKNEMGIQAEYVNLQKAEYLLRNREIMSYFIFFDNTCMALREESGKLSEQLKKLRTLVFEYDSLGSIVRIHYSDLGESLKQNGNIYMAHIFPSYSKDDLVRFAQSGLRLPAGITRHIVPGRILGFPLKTSFLKTSRISLHKKNEILQKMYEQKLVNSEMRYYPEGVFIFNE